MTGKVMRIRSLRALQKDSIVGIRTNLPLLGGLHPETLFPNGAQRGFDFALVAIEPGAADYLFVLRKNIPPDAKPRVRLPEWPSEIPAQALLANSAERKSGCRCRGQPGSLLRGLLAIPPCLPCSVDFRIPAWVS
jgi:hypothetical protein